jgi:hypothetical protein
MDKLQVRMQYRQAMAAAAEHQKLPMTAKMNLAIYRVYAKRLLHWSRGTLAEDFDQCSFDVEEDDVQLEEYEELLREKVKNVPELEELINRMNYPSDVDLDSDNDTETDEDEDEE